MVGDDEDRHCYIIEGSDSECGSECPVHTSPTEESPYSCRIIECEV
jgi:hypothetical protein